MKVGEHSSENEQTARRLEKTSGPEGAADQQQTSLPASRAALVLNLQRTLGNTYVQRYVSRATRDSASITADDLPARIQTARANGSPLEPSIQRPLETGLGAELSDVRVHTDGEADALAQDLRASAFTTGKDIFFRGGAYQPDTDAGRELIAHEAVHTVQQASGLAGAAPALNGLSVSHPTDPSEQAAEDIAQTLTSTQSQAVATPAPPAPDSSADVQRAVEEPGALGSDTSSAAAPAAAGPTASPGGPGPASAGATRPAASELPPLPGSPTQLTPPGAAMAGPPPAAPAHATPALSPLSMPAQPAPPITTQASLTPPAALPPQVPAPRTDPSHVAGAASQAQSTLTGLLAPNQLTDAATPGAQLIVSALQQAGDRGAAEVVAAANQAIAAIQAASIDQSTALEQAESEQTAVLHADFEQGQAQVQTTLTSQSEAIGTSATGEQARIIDWAQQTNVQAEQEVGARQQQLQVAGDEQAERARAAGSQAVSRATSALDSASAQAHQSANGGGGGANEAEQQGHAEVADRLGSDTADQIESAADQVDEQFGAHASEAASAVESNAETMAAAISSHLPTLQTSIAETSSGTAEQLGAHASNAVTGLTEHGQQAAEQLAATESRLTGELGGQAQASRDQLHEGAGQAIDAITNQAAQAVADARATLTDQASQVQAATVDEQTAADVAAQVDTDVSAAFSAATGDIGGVQGGITDELASIGASSVGALVDLPARAAGELTAATAGVTGELADAATQAIGSLAEAVDATTVAAGAAMATTSAALDDLVASGRDAMGNAVAEVGAGLDRGAAGTETRTSEATGGLQQRIQEGNRRVDEAVQSGDQTNVQRSILGDIVDWVADQLSSLWNMLKDPAFWIGLGVTLILFPFMGPGALVVGGLVGGAVSGIEQNIHEGKAWYDPHNIIVNAAIGTLAGAAFAFGGGFIVGLGLEGAAATGAVMALGGGIGIVINLATGQRWDKNLLANLFLAWLFHRLGGPREKGETPPEARPQPEAGGRTETQVPGLYSGIDPQRPVGGGWRFADTVTEEPTRIVVQTDVTAPDGTTGDVTRYVDTTTGQFTMDMAFLDSIPRELRWVQTDPPMVQGRGTPLETYLTMRQMRIMEGRTGNSAMFGGPRNVHMSTVINVRSTVELAQATRAGANPNDAALTTNSVQYASNSIIQSGGRISSATVSGGSMTRAGKPACFR